MFAFMSFALGNLSREALLQCMSENILRRVSSRSFAVSCVVFESSGQFECICVCAVREGPDCPDGHVAVWLSPQQFLKRLFAALCSFVSAVEDELPIGVWVYFWALYSFPLMPMAVLCQPHTVVILLFIGVSQVWEGDACSFILLPQSCFGNCESFVIAYKFSDCVL